MVFFEKRLKILDLFHSDELYIVMQYVVNVRGRGLKDDLIGKDGASVGINDGKEDTIGNI